MKNKDRILKACELIETVRAELFLAYHELIKDELDKGELDIEPLPQEKWEATCQNGVIKIYIPDYLPKQRFLSKEMRNFWLKNMIFAIQSIVPAPHFDKIFVYIKMFIPGTIWDVDNRSVKVIIDGIRYSRLIKDDTFEYVAYGVEGSNMKPYHTEVYIFDYNKINKILPQITQN